MIGRLAAAFLILVSVLAAATPAAAERRGFTVTSFDRIIVNGPFVVRVATGRGSSAYVEGDSAAIRQFSVQVTGRTLSVRRNVSSNWGGFPGESQGGSAVLHLSTPSLSQVTLVGTGDLEIDRIRSQRVTVSLGGNGRIAIGTIETDELALGVTGAGTIEAAGRAETGRVTVQGPGNILAAGLTIDDVTINLSGPGTITLTADREAEVVSSGNGNVTVLGDAACINRSIGSGEISCGGLAR